MLCRSIEFKFVLLVNFKFEFSFDNEAMLHCAFVTFQCSFKL